MAYERRRTDWWTFDGNPDDSLDPADLDYFETSLESIDSRVGSIEQGGAGQGGLIDEVIKSADYELGVSDNRKRIVGTAQITISVPDPGLLGNGFEARIVNDSGAGMVIAGGGAVTQMDDGDIATVMEVNGKQRIFKVASSLLNSTDTSWNPAMLGPDVVRWWDANDFRTFSIDETTGKVVQWDDKGYYQSPATQSSSAARPVLLPGEVRFTGAQSLVMPAASRAYIEHTWFAVLFRINWSNTTGTGGSFFAVNGLSGNTSCQPAFTYTKSGSNVTSFWRRTTSANNSLAAAIPGDDVWHMLVSRRAPDGVYLSVDGGTEQFLAGNAAMQLVGLPGIIGDYLGKASWGVDSIIFGQGELSQDNIDNLHGWGAWRKGITSALPALHPYKSTKPTAVAPAVEAPDGEADSSFDWDSMEWDQSHRGDELDLSGYSLIFEEEFDDLDSITDPVSGVGPLYAGGRPDTSIARFRTKDQTPPVFSVDDPSVLTISMQQISTGQWISGHLQTVNSWGEAVTEPMAYGYWECRMAFEGPVAWPAFWLYSKNRHKSTSATMCELDIIEAYATDPRPGHHSTMHRHSATRKQPGHLQGNTHHSNINYLDTATNTPIWGIDDLWDGEFHTYGLLVTPDLIIVYLDGLEMSRHPMFPEAHLEKFALISLQMQDPDVSLAESPTNLLVDYLRIYEADAAEEAGFGIAGFGEVGFGE